MKKNSRKILFLITCIFFIFTIVSVVQTYAKYVTSVQGTTNTSIARWNILVNNVSIKTGTDLSSVLTPVFAGNENIAPNVLAPNAEGYFDLALDFSQVDVSFDYSVSVSPHEDSSITDLIVTGYSIDGGETEAFEVSGNESILTNNINYTNDILEGTTYKTIRVFVKWNDDPLTSNMNNSQDANATLNEDNVGSLNVNVSFTQTT